jgi:hypothetical protein
VCSNAANMFLSVAYILMLKGLIIMIVYFIGCLCGLYCFRVGDVSHLSMLSSASASVYAREPNFTLVRLDSCFRLQPSCARRAELCLCNALCRWGAASM